MRRFLTAGLAFLLAAPLWAEPRIEVSSYPVPQNPDAYQRIKVAVLENQPSLKLFTASPYRIESPASQAVMERGNKLNETSVAPFPAGIRFGRKEWKVTSFRIVSLKPAAPIRVSGKTFQQSVQVIKGPNGNFTVVNEIDLEEYLKGVLPKEMWVDWPAEALKAQAVVSRSFALFKALSKSNEDYMLKADVIGQVFGGHGADKPQTNKAVAATRGEIITYKGEIFPAYFHSACAGHTTHPEYNWDIRPHPALEGVPCLYCVGTKHYRWQSSLSFQDLEKKFKAAGRAIGRIRLIVPQKWDESGRAREILVRHWDGDLTLRGNDFRLIAGPEIVKSLKDLRITYKGDQILFSGYGWGHGVGMCQWGAKVLADNGKTYREIIEYYYPGTQITKIGK